MICKTLKTRFGNVYENVGLSENKEFPDFVNLYKDDKYLKTINKSNILEYEEDRSSKEDAVIATALIDNGIDLFINAMVNCGKTKEGIIEQLEIILDDNINAYSNRQ